MMPFMTVVPPVVEQLTTRMELQVRVEMCPINHYSFSAMKIMKDGYENGTATTYPKPEDFESFIKAQLYDYEYDNSYATLVIYA